jgi:hypothetical protein
MKPSILLFLFLAMLNSAMAQTEKLYAISAANEQFNWLNIQLIEGKETKTVYDYKNQNVYFINALTNTAMRAVKDHPAQNGPTGSMVAALGFDELHQQLFFIPMQTAELRWADLSNPAAPRYFSRASPVLSNLNMTDAANHFTRMTIGADRYGYALTNDGNHFIRFTTGVKPVLKDLGGLIDAASNGQMSVHNQCAGWGGDMVAAEDGSLYLFTQRSHVYKIDTDTRVAKYIGQLKGLPENFTSNGAAVDDNGDVLISCATGNMPLYRVNLKTLDVSPESGELKHNLSDMASGNLAFRKRPAGGSRPGIQNFGSSNLKLSVYPNPVTENRLNVNFESVTRGIHHIQLVDLSGKVLLNRVVNISGPLQISEVVVPSVVSKGVYFVKILNENAKAIYSEKIILQ